MNWGRLIRRIAGAAGQADDERQLLAVVLAEVVRSECVDFAAVVAPRQGNWTARAQAGSARSLPLESLAEAADREAPVLRDGWVIAPTAPRGGQLLALHGSDPGRLPTAESVGELAALVHELAAMAERGHRLAQRVQRLETVLRIAGQWNAHTEMVPLLEQMARSATELLGCDRASLFLWDRPNRTLVGRPALGVPGGELRIPDHLGLVGRVIASGLCQRVGAGDDNSAINRQVDEQTGYQTRTLLCVPLRGKSGELFGAFEAINKRGGDFSDDDQLALDELALHAAAALEKTRQLQQLVATHRQMVEQAAEGVQLVGQSPAIEALRSTVRRVAGTDLAVLILGENGTGKEVVSRMIHYHSRRRDQPFIAVNCAAISETLLESELFGHEKGAFTDAHETRRGKFELAAGGTLFLDEIGDLSPGGQAKLLRVLEEKVVVRVGGSKPIHSDARVIAATNQDLAAMVRERRFRQDLYFRLNVVSLVLPPLRERGEDVPLLWEHFLEQFCRQAHRRGLTLSAGARRRLVEHSWPGNVRELRNLAERLAYLSPGDEVQADELVLSPAPTRESFSMPPPDLTLTEATDRFQVEYVKRAIDAVRGNMSDAARRLGLHRSNLYRKMRQLGMPTGE